MIRMLEKTRNLGVFIFNVPGSYQDVEEGGYPKGKTRPAGEGWLLRRKWTAGAAACSWTVSELPPISLLIPANTRN